MDGARQKQDRALELREAGMSYAQIANSEDVTAPAPRGNKPRRRLYGSSAAARQAVLVARERHAGEVKAEDVPAEERRALLDNRYERIIEAYMPLAADGDNDATELLLQALAQQAQLHGLNT